MSEVAPTFDRNLDRITTREQAFRHLSKVLEVNGSFNPSTEEAEIHDIPGSLTDLAVFFRSDSGEFATTEEPYTLFLNRYNLENGTIPSHKFKINDWNGIPCLKVSILE
jgi:hypothetical protein